MPETSDPDPVVPSTPRPALPWIVATVVSSSLAVGAIVMLGIASWTTVASYGWTGYTGTGSYVPLSTFDEGEIADVDPSEFLADAPFADYVGFGGVDSLDGLEVGTCYLLGGVDELAVVPSCATPHDAEVYATDILPDGDFPGIGAVGDRVYDTCETAFFEDVGERYLADGADFGGYAPTEEGWAGGGREIVCFATLYSPQRTGSLLD